MDKATYISRLSYAKDDINGQLETLGLDWEDFSNDWIGSVEKMYAKLPATTYEPREWLNYFHDNKLPWGEHFNLELHVYPGTVFHWKNGANPSQ